MNTQHTRQNCNWIVVQAQQMRKEVKAIKLKDIHSLEDKISIIAEVQAMDYRQLDSYLKGLK